MHGNKEYLHRNWLFLESALKELDYSISEISVCKAIFFNTKSIINRSKVSFLSGYSRTHVSTIITKLKRDGVIEYNKVNVDLIKTKLHQKESSLHSISKELSDFSKLTNDNYYEGYYEILDIFRSLLKRDNPIVVYGDSFLFKDYISTKQFNNWVTDRINSKIPVTVITNRNPLSVVNKQNDLKEQRTTKFVENVFRSSIILSTDETTFSCDIIEQKAYKFSNNLSLLLYNQLNHYSSLL